MPFPSHSIDFNHKQSLTQCTTYFTDPPPDRQPSMTVYIIPLVSIYCVLRVSGLSALRSAIASE